MATYLWRALGIRWLAHSSSGRHARASANETSPGLAGLRRYVRRRIPPFILRPKRGPNAMWRARRWAAGQVRRPPPAMLAVMISCRSLEPYPTRALATLARCCARSPQGCAARREWTEDNCDQQTDAMHGARPCLSAAASRWARHGGFGHRARIGRKIAAAWASSGPRAFLALQLANRKCITSPSLTA